MTKLILAVALILVTGSALADTGSDVVAASRTAADAACPQPNFPEKLACLKQRSADAEAAARADQEKRRIELYSKAQATFAEYDAMQASAAKAKAAAAKAKGGVQIGMTQQQALASSWGKPNHVNRTTTASGTREQWVYGGHNYLYFSNGVLTSIQN